MHVPYILFNGIEVGNGSKEREASLGERGLCNKEGMEGSVYDEWLILLVHSNSPTYFFT